MKVSCPSCSTNYNIDERRIPATGAKLKCAKCQSMFPVKPPATAAPEAAPGAVPLPGPSVPRPPSAAVPLPGITTAKPRVHGAWEDEATRVATNPIPSEALRDAVPLPGHASATLPEPPAPPAPPAFSLGGGFESTDPTGEPEDGYRGRGTEPEFPAVPGGAVPLPGSVDQAASQPWDEQPTRVGVDPGDAVPLPGASSNDADVGFADADLVDPDAGGTQLNSMPFDAPAGGAVPLPGAGRSYVPPPPAIAPYDDAPPTHSAVPLPGAAPEFAVDDSPPPPAHAAIPLPGDPGFSFGAPPAQSAVPLPGDQGFSFGAPPAQPAMPLPSDPDFSFGAPPEAPPSPEDFAAPAPPATPDGFSLDDLPSPAEPPPSAPDGFSLDDLPSPAASPDLPSPKQSADDFNLDFIAPPSAPPRAAPPPPKPAPAFNPSTSFGEVDLGGPAPASGGDGLEFDPTQAPPPKDDLEADLSAPVAPAPPTGSADGLEMLDFIDRSAEDNKAAAQPKVDRFHVKRRSGKSFGPFDEAVIVKMLEDGQLLGNEEISSDGTTWAAIGTVKAFSAAIQKLMEAPSKPASPTQPAVAASRPESAPSMDRLRQVYEGRMAAVAVVDRSQPLDELKKRLPLILGLVVVLTIVGAGLFMGTTPYGVFGIKYFLPAKVSPGTKEFAELERARKALSIDTFKSYQEARDATATLLGVREFPEVRAVWCQSIFYLQRRYAAAKPEDLQTASSGLENLRRLGRKSVEVTKAVAGAALVEKRFDDALQAVDEALARTENQNDSELSFLRAEAYRGKGQGKLAAEELKKVLARQKQSAKALHALGDVYQREKKTDDAAQAYAEALAADPKHLSSAVELASLELLSRKDAEKGSAAIEQALAADGRSLLGPTELAHALGLRAEALALAQKTAEATAAFEEALAADKTSVFAKAGLARVYLSQGQFDKAIPMLKEVSAADPQSLEYTEGYLTALIAIGKLDEAGTLLASASKRFAGNARIAFLAGRVADALDETKQAEDSYVRAANADPKMFEANLALARMFLRMRRPQSARPQLEAALSKAPDNAAVRAGMGELALAEGDLARAESDFKAALDSDASLPEAHLGLSRVALERGDLVVAQSSVEKALERNASLTEARVQLGLVSWKRGKLAEAVAELDKARLAEPRSARVHTLLGAVKLDAGDGPGAERSLLAALSREPTNPDALFYLALVKAQRKEFTGALDSMRDALERQPKNARFHYELGNILRDAKRPSEAMDEWKAAAKLDPKMFEPHEAIGQAMLDGGDNAEAIKQFKLALDAAPDRVRLWVLLGDGYFAAGKWNDAIGIYLKALGRDESQKQLYYKVARSYSEKGQGKQAIEWYKKATQSDPDNAMPWYYLGYAFKEKGQRKEATAAFKTYLAKKPGAEDKKEIEDEIYYLGGQAEPKSPE